jgi:hypothetical protein
LGEDEERDDLGASADPDALPPEQIREDAGNDAVSEDCIWRYEKAEEPGTFFCGGRIEACDLLQGGFLHANDGSMSIAFSALEIK